MNNQKTYSEKLRDPRWQKKRLEIMQRDDFTCQLCKDKNSTLHVHHKHYISGNEPWEYQDDNFITYCEACHDMVEDVKPHDVISVHKQKGKSFALMFGVIKYFESLMIGIYELDEKTKTLTCKSAILDKHVAVLSTLLQDANNKLKSTNGQNQNH